MGDDVTIPRSLFESMCNRCAALEIYAASIYKIKLDGQIGNSIHKEFYFNVDGMFDSGEWEKRLSEIKDGALKGHNLLGNFRL